MPNVKTPNPAEFKLDTVHLVKESGRRISHIARDIGITRQSINVILNSGGLSNSLVMVKKKIFKDQGCGKSDINLISQRI
jgi:hypothetical protein